MIVFLFIKYGESNLIPDKVKSIRDKYPLSKIIISPILESINEERVIMHVLYKYEDIVNNIFVKYITIDYHDFFLKSDFYSMDDYNNYVRKLLRGLKRILKINDVKSNLTNNIMVCVINEETYTEISKVDLELEKNINSKSDTNIELYRGDYLEDFKPLQRYKQKIFYLIV